MAPPRADLREEILQWLVVGVILLGPLVRRVLREVRAGGVPRPSRPPTPPAPVPERRLGTPVTWEDLLAGRVPEPPPPVPEPAMEPEPFVASEPGPTLADVEWQSVLDESALEAAGAGAESAVPAPEPVEAPARADAGLAVGLPMGGHSRHSRAGALVRGRLGRRVPRAWRQALLLAEVVGPPVALRRSGDGPLPPASMA